MTALGMTLAMSFSLLMTRGDEPENPPCQTNSPM